MMCRLLFLTIAALLVSGCGERPEMAAELPPETGSTEKVDLAEIEGWSAQVEGILKQNARDRQIAGGQAATHPPEAHVFDISENADGIATTTRIEVGHRDDDGRIWAEISTVRHLWRLLEDGSLELVASSEEGVHVASSSAPWFSDQTEKVIGTTTAFENHLSHGLDHWLARVEAAHGIDAFIRNGMALGDADGDGRDDLYICQPGGLPNRLFIHGSDDTAVEATDAGTDYLDHTSAALFLDLDNDGDQDLALATPAGIVLLENEGGAKFANRGTLHTDSSDCHSLTAADFDLDGDLDLYLTFALGDVFEGEEAGEFRFHDARDGGRNQLFGNDGGWSFSELTDDVGLGEGNDRHSLAAAWADYDLDGDPDLYVANDYGPNQLYRNDAGSEPDGRSEPDWRASEPDWRTFVEVAAAAGVQDFGAGMSVSWGDYDRDGLIDLYVGNMFSNAGRRITGQGGFLGTASKNLLSIYKRFAKGNTLFRQGPAGAFNERSGHSEMGRWAWSSVFADLDNDGWEDLFVANGYITGPESDDL
jgi:hypothetical protein